MTALAKAEVQRATARKTFGKSDCEAFTFHELTEKQPANPWHRISEYVQLGVLMGFCRRKLEAILGDTGGISSTTTFYKSAALPTELRQPKPCFAVTMGGSSPHPGHRLGGARL